MKKLGFGHQCRRCTHAEWVQFKDISQTVGFRDVEAGEGQNQGISLKSGKQIQQGQRQYPKSKTESAKHKKHRDTAREGT